jgi:UDPglucose 6-dehydrogenase
VRQKGSILSGAILALASPVHPITAGRTRLRATQDFRRAAAGDVSFSILPSPSLPDESFSNEFLLRAVQRVAAAVRETGKKGHLFVCRSTTKPGAVDTALIRLLERETGEVCGRDFCVC